MINPFQFDTLPKVTTGCDFGSTTLGQSKMASNSQSMPSPRQHTVEPMVIYAVWKISYGVKELKVQKSYHNSNKHKDLDYLASTSSQIME